MSPRQTLAGADSALPDGRFAGYWIHAPLIVALMLATVCFRINENIPHLGIIRPAALATYGGGLVLITLSSVGARRSMAADRTLRLVIAYVAWMWVTAPFALWPGLALTSANVGIPLVVVIASVLLCAPNKDALDSVIDGFWIGAALLGAIVAVVGPAPSDEIGARLTTNGTLDSNDLAAIMALALPFSIAAVIRRHGGKRLLAIVAVVINTGVIVRTGSRGGTLALAAGCLIFMLGFRGAKKFIAFAVLIAGASFLWFFAPSGYRERITGLTDVSDDYNYTAYTGRKQIWARARGYIAEHPIMGVGAGNFPIAEGDYAAALGRPAKWSATHNAYLQAFSELGVVGGGLFVALLITTGRRAWPMWRGTRCPPDWHRPEFFASICAFCTSAYFLSHAYFYPLFGLVAVVALADRTRLALTRRAPPPAKRTLPSAWRSARRPVPQPAAAPQ